MNAAPRDLARAQAALGRAAELVRRHTAAAIPFEQKGTAGPVTAADREVDALLRGCLPEPGDGWLSEESEDDASRLGCRRVWVVDPIDGTRSFVAGRPEYAVSIALVIDGEPVLGAIANPATGVSVCGGVGLGVVVAGAPQVPWADEPAALRVLTSRSEWRRGEWSDLAALCRIRPCGSVAYKLALVAAGQADATWTRLPKSEWDVAAGAALVRAAGGEVWLPDGGTLAWNRPTPRFLAFAACGPGLRPRVESLLLR